jgi:hypothetical protein
MVSLECRGNQMPSRSQSTPVTRDNRTEVMKKVLSCLMEGVN